MSTPTNIVEFLTADANKADYTTLVEAAGFADVVPTLQGEDLMLFAPTNDVFNNGGIDQYRWNKALTTDLLLNHAAAKTELNTTPKQIDTALGNTITATNTQISKVDSIDQTPAISNALKVNDDDNKYAIYNINGFLIPKSQSEAPITLNLYEGANSRLGGNQMSSDLQATLEKLAPVENDPLFDEKLGYTVFLPTAEAFNDLFTAVGGLTGVSEYLEDGGLDETLLAHTVVGGAPVKAFDYVSANSKAESKIEVDLTNKKVTIGSNDADLATDAANFKNGQVHDINKVLYFPRENTVQIAEAATKKLFGLIASVTGLADSLKGLTRSTVFAPTDAALEPLLCLNGWNSVVGDNIEKVLKHHVLSGSRVYSKDVPDVATTLSGEDIVRADIKVAAADVIATNGNIHVVDKVLVPPSLRSDLPKGTITEIAADATQTLASFVVAAGLDGALNTCPATGKAYTVFAPSDEAFSLLTDADKEYLTKNNFENLKKVLLHHVVSAPAFAADLAADQSFDTLNGDKVVVKKSAEGVFVGSSAKVITNGADVLAYNGVIHIIDEVLIPEGIELPSSKIDGAGSMTTVSAISTALLGAASYFLAAF